MADFPSRRDAAPQQDTAGSPITERNKPEVTWLQLRCEQKFLGDLVFPSSLFINGEADDPSQNKQHASHQALIRDVLRKAFNLKVTGNGCSAPHVKLRCTAWQPTARRGNGPATSRPAPRTVVVTPQTLQDVAECAKESGEGRAYLDVPPRRELPKPAAGCVRLWIHPAERDSQGLERITGIEISLDVLKQQGLALILREVLDREEITPPSPPLMLLPEMVQLTDENFVERCTNSIAQSDQCHVDILLGTGEILNCQGDGKRRLKGFRRLCQARFSSEAV